MRDDLLASPAPRISDRDYGSVDARKVAKGWLVRFVRRVVERGRTDAAGVLEQLMLEPSVESLLHRHGVTTDALRAVVVDEKARAPAVELVNDSTTPFDFVTHALWQLAGMDEASARAFALAVHLRGREWFGVASNENAGRIVTEILEQARAAGFPLDARVVVESPVTGGQ